MMKIGWLIGRGTERSIGTVVRSISACTGVALLLTLGGRAIAQDQAGAPGTNGYDIHHTADLGGRIANISGSGRMYDTLVNMHSGPRVLGQTFTMRALPGTKHGWFDDLSAFSNGFGGDPNNFAKLDVSKGKLYEFSGTFRRDRQYFDYNLLDSPNLPVNNIPYGYTNGVASALTFQNQHLLDSGMMFNTVRRMMDTNLTILPLSKVTFRAGYSHSIFQGPSTMTNRSIGKYDALLRMYQRNSTDDFTAAVDWKPFQHTKLTFEEIVDHYKADSFFTLDPSDFVAQEADGTPVALGNYDALPSATAPAQYGASASGVCATNSMGTAFTSSTTYTIFSAPNTPGGLPIINPACDVVTSYLRTQPTRSIYPTEMFRFQSTSIRNIALNGDIRYSVGNTDLSNFYENWQGFDVSTTAPAGGFRSATFTGKAHAQRRVVAMDYAMTWNATKTISLSDQVEFNNVHQPGTTTVTSGATLETPATAGNQTINYSGALTAGAPYNITGNPNGSTLLGLFSQRWLSNNATVTWDASTKTTLSLTYRYRTHRVLRGNPLGEAGGCAGVGIPCDQWDINENAGVFNAAFRPTNKWDMNGTIEIAYNDNAFTPMTPRQLRHYRFHTLYRPKPWATLSGAFNDLERHNNTNNAGTGTPDGLLQHKDYSRYGSLGLSLSPNEHYGFDFNYSYSDVYITTNACYSNGTAVQATAPTTVVFVGAASTNSAGTANICPTNPERWGPVPVFVDAPTQFASAALSLTPSKAFHADLGYRISAVSGNQFFNDAQEVNGSLQSAYQSPFLSASYTVRPGWIWKAEYDYYGYGEGGPSGAKFCSTYTSASAPVVPCSNFPGLTAISLTGPAAGAGFTAPRNFHANNITIGMHYEF